ncbi:MAG TPA: hypothetical protein VNV41_02645 [Candidatus Acidoferrales bacterium]|jgi:hypothetical protein|nr:hypothetical protein [Candidatus Acidoferrales bacterium]
MTKPVPRIKDDPELLAALEESGAVVHLADGRGGTVYFSKDRFVAIEEVTVRKVMLRDGISWLVTDTAENIRAQLGERTDACPIHTGRTSCSTGN